LTQAISHQTVTLEVRLLFLTRPCQIFGGQSCPGTPLFSHYFGFPLSVSCCHCSVRIFVHMFLLPKEQTGETGRLPRSSAVLGTVQHWIEKYFKLRSL